MRLLAFPARVVAVKKGPICDSHISIAPNIVLFLQCLKHGRRTRPVRQEWRCSALLIIREKPHLTPTTSAMSTVEC